MSFILFSAPLSEALVFSVCLVLTGRRVHSSSSVRCRLSERRIEAKTYHSRHEGLFGAWKILSTSKYPGSPDPQQLTKNWVASQDFSIWQPIVRISATPHHAVPFRPFSFSPSQSNLWLALFFFSCQSCKNMLFSTVMNGFVSFGFFFFRFYKATGTHT